LFCFVLFCFVLFYISSFLSRIGAEFLLLTHFSQRYPKLPLLEGSPETIKMFLSFDFLTLPFLESTHLGLLFPALQYLFRDEEKEQE